MTVLYAAFWVVSLVLVAAGTTKVAGPEAFAVMVDRYVAGPRALLVARVVGIFEMLVGFAALAVGTRGVAVLVALMYGLFAAVVVVAMRRGLPSCGCFGARSSSPNPLHVSLNIASALLAVAAAVSGPPPMAEALTGLGLWAPMIVVCVLGATVAVVFVETRQPAATFSRHTSTGGSSERRTRR